LQGSSADDGGRPKLTATRQGEYTENGGMDWTKTRKLPRGEVLLLSNGLRVSLPFGARPIRRRFAPHIEAQSPLSHDNYQSDLTNSFALSRHVGLEPFATGRGCRCAHARVAPLTSISTPTACPSKSVRAANPIIISHRLAEAGRVNWRMK
jgi:hypothetical protein